MTIAKWNLLVYAIAGDDQEHQAVLGEIDDMREALSSDQCNIAVQVMAKGRTTRYWISSDDKNRTESLAGSVDASRQTALTGFLDAAGRRLPASSTALVLRAHGSGLDYVHDYPSKGGGLGGGGPLGHAGRLDLGAALAPRAALGREVMLGRAGLAIEPLPRPERYGCRWGPDPNTGHFLTNVTMKKAIAGSVDGRVDVLALNACWMATLEIAYELRGVADVEVASQVNAKPWPYRAIVTSLSRSPARSAGELARTIVASVEDEIAEGRRQDAVSAFWSGSAVEDLAAAFGTYAKRVTALIDTDWPGVHDAVMTKAQRIDDPHQVDLVSLTRVLGKQDPSARAAGDAVRARFRSMRIANVAHTAHPHVNGLSIFCPKSTRIDLADAYKGTEFRTNRWAGFLAKFQRRLASS